MHPAADPRVPTTAVGRAMIAEVRARPRPIGTPTRGTTNPNRLRRVDTWLCATHASLMRRTVNPVVVDLGYGASPITVLELRTRLAQVSADVRVVGVEIDPERVRVAASYADPPWVEFRVGGFELAGLRPVVIRAMNVLRQYSESAVEPAWATMLAHLAPDGIIIEGTCDELGRIGSWLTIPGGLGVPSTLTCAVDLTTLDHPTTVAQRLPKALIHHNVPGQGVHALMTALDRGWAEASPYASFGPRQRFVRAVEAAREAGWPIHPQHRRWRRGEFTVAWSAVDPAGGDIVVRRPTRT